VTGQFTVPPFGVTGSGKTTRAMGQADTGVELTSVATRSIRIQVVSMFCRMSALLRQLPRWAGNGSVT
jgi:hypothetical protein